MQQGKASIQFEQPVRIISRASVGSKKEKEGPLGQLIDYIDEDPKFGKNTWEEAESQMQFLAAQKAIEKAGISQNKIRYIFAGDLLGQNIATSFGIMNLNIPLFGLYGACSTMGESLSLGAMTMNAGYADYVICMTSSHFASAEKEFRYPLEYGNQRPFSATWTVTGSGAVVLGKEGGMVEVKGITTGQVIDYGIKDSMNMGAAMAPAAADTIYHNFTDFNISPDYYDKIITGDLGYIGQTALIDLLKKKGYDISKVHTDCGIEIYDGETQDTHAGGSGCGCSAVTLCSYILKQMEERKWKRVLFVPTGALLSTVSFNEGQSIPGIAHAVMLEAVN